MATRRRKTLPFQEPAWHVAPPWAQYWAVNKDGFACWYAAEPRRGCTVWWNRIGTQRQAALPRWFLDRLCMTGLDWRETLRSRPQPNQVAVRFSPLFLPQAEE
jgi:hypothetical protein